MESFFTLHDSLCPTRSIVLQSTATQNNTAQGSSTQPLTSHINIAWRINRPATQIDTGQDSSTQPFTSALLKALTLLFVFIFLYLICYSLILLQFHFRTIWVVLTPHLTNMSRFFFPFLTLLLKDNILSPKRDKKILNHKSHFIYYFLIVCKCSNHICYYFFFHF